MKGGISEYGRRPMAVDKENSMLQTANGNYRIIYITKNMENTSTNTTID